MVAPELFTQGYRPLFWTCFGGPGGMYLANLVKIRFILLLGRIDFSFNRPDVPVECQSFGQASDWEHSGAERVDFAIDGPGGEKIQRVKIRQELALDDLEGWRGRGGRVISLKVRSLRWYQIVWQTLAFWAKQQTRSGPTAGGNAKSHHRPSSANTRS